MSIEKLTHVGSYLEIQLEPIIEQKTIMICPNHKTHEYKDSMFYCSLCGTKLEPKIIQGQTYFDWMELLNEKDQEKYEGYLWQVTENKAKQTVYLIGNLRNQFGPDNLSVKSGEGAIEITVDIINECLTNFSRQYEKLINKLLTSKTKGLKIKFGFITFWN